MSCGLSCSSKYLDVLLVKVNYAKVGKNDKKKAAPTTAYVDLDFDKMEDLRDQ